ncbi:MAG: hypothetical protein AUJ52_06735 [Elusimicrobia bacterium CG1_02_63_36]|nr:MAG: hypothetical protein AUJ52_06735 [Elusimicrobia bacterium CG1_02_63_36]PIP81495.1 MAG: hypothetical protein COR54_19945 [Elusimicrobia bacterium CG22_combo_CG10-13_8_21_14_all_63_91]PJB24300.1 MAG: hypothetical protein CO113_14485 [Elusimicrobia bacterium CG_4_9_14_3_um_filter_62_55]
MPNLTLAISEEIKQRMAMFPEINWSEVARQAIIEKTKIMEHAQTLLAGSKLTEQDAVRLGEQAKLKVSKRHS